MAGSLKDGEGHAYKVIENVTAIFDGHEAARGGMGDTAARASQ